MQSVPQMHVLGGGARGARGNDLMTLRDCRLILFSVLEPNSFIYLRILSAQFENTRRLLFGTHWQNKAALIRLF